jgi:hypothetical protein
MLATAIITVITKKWRLDLQGFPQIPRKATTIQRDTPLPERHGKSQLIA